MNLEKTGKIFIFLNLPKGKLIYQKVASSEIKQYLYKIIINLFKTFVDKPSLTQWVFKDNRDLSIVYFKNKTSTFNWLY